jgi:tetratricopeptide (TPR) repeat protein
MRSKPFYLELPGNNGRSFITLGLMVGVLGAAVPYFLIIVPFLIGYGILQIKRSKSVNYRSFESAIRYYETGNIQKSREVLDTVKDDVKLQIRITILRALINYEEKDYNSYVEIIKTLPEKKTKLELDLQLKLGESLMRVKDYEEALKVYTYILKFNSKSSYINNKINECSGMIKKENDK